MQELDFSSIPPALEYLFADGMATTLLITAFAASIGILLGLVLAAMRLSSSCWISIPAMLYINFFRSIPLILVIFTFYFLMPHVIGWIVLSPHPIKIGALQAALISFTLYEAAYFAEIIRAGLQSVSKGQIFAGQAISLTNVQIFRYVVLPQAIRNMIPPLLMRTLILFQDTSLVYVVSLSDFLGAATNIGQRDGRLTEMYLFVAATYFVICFVISKAVNRLDRHLKSVR